MDPKYPLIYGALAIQAIDQFLCEPTVLLKPKEILEFLDKICPYYIIDEDIPKIDCYFDDNNELIIYTTHFDLLPVSLRPVAKISKSLYNRSQSVRDIINRLPLSTWQKFTKHSSLAVRNQSLLVIPNLASSEEITNAKNISQVNAEVFKTIYDTPPELISEKKTCAVCKIEESVKLKMKYCSICKSVRYCSAECQKKDWKTHKLVCKK